jgi:predicted GNAT superfamily acetyltransferase
MEEHMDIRELKDDEHFEQCLDLQRHIWGFQDIDIVPSATLKMFAEGDNPWGVLLGVFEQSDLMGFLFCMPTGDAKTLVMDMLGVLPTYQRQGVGYHLMERLKTIARARGIEKIIWTYDPLESVNANLYFHKMHAVCHDYAEEYYKFHDSKTHAGFPADRFKMELSIEDRPIPYDDSSIFTVAIPGNFQQMRAVDPTVGIVWREKTRPVFRRINTEGYTVIDFVYHPDTCTGEYVLAREIS